MQIGSVRPRHAGLQLCSDDPIARGAAQLAQLTLLPRCESVQALIHGSTAERVAVVMSDPDPLNPEAWQQQVQGWVVHWIAPLMEALRRGALERVRLHAARGCYYELRRSDLWRFWRRPVELRSLAVGNTSYS